MSKYDGFYTFDEPVPYKSITLYPVKVKDFDIFYKCVQVLALEKNSIPDIKIISMSYLEYIYYLHDKVKGEKEIDYLILLDILLKLCMNDKESKMILKYGRNKKDKPVLEIDGKLFDELDFEEIKTIICDQNLVTLPDETVQKVVRDKMEEARKYKEGLSGNKPASFEDTMLCLIISTNMSLEQVKELSLRKFIKLLQRVDAKLHYQIYMTGQMSGMVEFKDKSILRHWMSDLEKENKNNDVMVDFNQIKGKLESKA